MTKRYLIIDDDPLFTKLLSYRLGAADENAHIDTLDPNNQGWPTNRSAFDRYDIIFLDYLLGEYDGIRCLQSIRQLTRKAYIVLMSGTSNERDAVMAVKAGADNYLPKTLLTPDRLREVIHSCDSRSDSSTASGLYNASTRTGTRRRPGHLLFPQLEGYSIRRKIGVGGMATVYLAERKFDQELVVIKVIDTTEAGADQLVKRTKQEYHLLSQVDHPHVVVIDDMGEHDGLLYIVMERFSAGDLKQRIEHRFSTLQATRYLCDIASGLVAMEKSGLIHRDLKPSNIMFRDDETLAIIDFSVAKKMGQAERLTQQGEVVGTPYYMSPEQSLGHSELDIRTDIYSLGIIFYEMLLGRKPYYAKDLQQLMTMQRQSPLPELPSHFNNFNEVLEKMTAKDPNDRFASAAELNQYLDRYR
ncbi:serine/threonine protein kinase [gamma proteobacterium HTCC5015]|nr:serine/threonine protein kinase [gamma proteobacterium HTCC5015]